MVLAEKGKKTENITKIDLNCKINTSGFTMYFTDSLSISFLANTVDLNYQMRRKSLSSLLLLLTWLWHNRSGWGGNGNWNNVWRNSNEKWWPLQKNLINCYLRVTRITLFLETDTWFLFSFHNVKWFAAIKHFNLQHWFMKSSLAILTFFPNTHEKKYLYRDILIF